MMHLILSKLRYFFGHINYSYWCVLEGVGGAPGARVKGEERGQWVTEGDERTLEESGVRAL